VHDQSGNRNRATNFGSMFAEWCQYLFQAYSQMSVVKGGGRIAELAQLETCQGIPDGKLGCLFSLPVLAASISTAIFLILRFTLPLCSTSLHTDLLFLPFKVCIWRTKFRKYRKYRMRQFAFNQRGLHCAARKRALFKGLIGSPLYFLG